MIKLKSFVLVLFFIAITYFSFIIGGNIGRMSDNKQSNIVASSSQSSSKDVDNGLDAKPKDSLEAADNKNLGSKLPNTQKSPVKTTNVKPKEFKILVDTNKQRVYIYDKKSGALYKEFICSTGLDGETETVKGDFEIQDRGYSFYNPKYGDGAYYWVRFYKTYLFHSVPFDKKERIIEAEAAKLGEKASHGCIRLSLENSKWFYDNIPRGTEVTVK
jgi:lipoprotein-anchoring transpeptidase ErfK/SrfK